jgi:predicted metal-dependent phosphoesterase TrpH
MMVEFDLHIHSKYSFDGIMSPSQIVYLAKQRGLAGIAVTDHNTIAGGMEALEVNRDQEFLVIVGAEMSTEVGDILGLFLNDEVKSRNSREVIAEIHAQGGLAILPHPYHHHRALVVDLLEQFDAVEVYNGRDRGNYSSRVREEFAEPHSLTMMGNSDAHLYWEIGRARTCMEIEQLDAQSVRQALISRRCEPLKIVPGQSVVAVYLSKIIKRLRRLR